MADKLYTLTLNEEQIKIIAFETRKYAKQLLDGGDLDTMPLPLAVVYYGYDSVYQLCREVLAVHPAGSTTVEEPTEETTEEGGETSTPDTETPETPETEPDTGEDTEWVRPEEYKDSPLTDDEIKELLGWLGQ